MIFIENYPLLFQRKRLNYGAAQKSEQANSLRVTIEKLNIWFKLIVCTLCTCKFFVILQFYNLFRFSILRFSLNCAQPAVKISVLCAQECGERQHVRENLVGLKPNPPLSGSSCGVKFCGCFRSRQLNMSFCVIHFILH